MAAESGPLMDFIQANRFCRVKTPLGEGVFAVSSLVVEEEISESFRCELELLSSDPGITADKLIGQSVTVTLKLPGGGTRHFNGLVSRFSHAGILDRLILYRITVVPTLWLMTRRTDSRVFENQDILNIVRTMLKEHDVLLGKAEKPAWLHEREVCVQYQETDADFFARLLESEGLFYYFTHTEDGHELQIGADSTKCPEVPGLTLIPLRTREGDELEHEIQRWQSERELRSGALVLADYNFVDGREAKLDDTKSRAEAPTFSKLEIFEYPADAHRQNAADVELVSQLDERKKLHMEMEDALVAASVGTSNCRHFAPGHKFKLSGHGNDKENIEYLIIAVRHTATQEGGYAGSAAKQSYTNTFSCIPLATKFRPQRVTPQPKIYGVQTGFVVGEEDEEIATDALGRLRVMLHWDRERKDIKDQRGITCWARVAQPMAGNRWGSMMIPRVGHEVVVQFVDGDPDRPLVVGSVYNGTHALPFDKPTQSGWRTRSTPDGAGANYNEIRFEDKIGEEKLSFQAEKDMYGLVKNDQHHIVRKDRFDHVDNNHHEKIVADHRVEIGKDRHLNIVGKEAHEIGGSQSLHVEGDVIHTYAANHSQKISGNSYVDSGGDIVIEGADSITLKVGGSSCVIDNTGVTLKGSIITLDGSMTNINSGAGSSAGSGSLGDAVAPTEPDEAQLLEDEAKSDTAQAAKSSSAPAHKPPPKDVEKATESAAAKEEPEKQDWIEIELADGEGNPLAGEKYEVKLPDGSVAAGTLDEKGYARVDGVDPGKCQVSFPDADKDSWEKDS